MVEALKPSTVTRLFDKLQQMCEMTLELIRGHIFLNTRPQEYAAEVRKYSIG